MTVAPTECNEASKLLRNYFGFLFSSAKRTIVSSFKVFFISLETKMGKISKILLNSLVISSAGAEVFQVTGCNDETLDVSKD